MFVPTVSANWAEKDAESLLWLASYPRSGNTFTRILLANYFAASDEAFDINHLHDFIPPDTSSVLWENICPDEAGPDLKERSWQLRPSFIEQYRRLPKSSPLAGLKTHTANVSVFGTDGFSFRSSDRIVYIVRHPLDVVLSYSDYNDRDLESAIDVMCQSGTYVQTDFLGGFEMRGSWSEHVASWLQASPCPLLLVRYEELCGSTEEALKGILAFLGAPIVPERIRHAVETSRFDKVREQEASGTFNEAPATLRSGNFFRKGKALQWLRELSPEQASRLADGCGEIMQRLGYAHPRDVFFGGRNALMPINLSG